MIVNYILFYKWISKGLVEKYVGVYSNFYRFLIGKCIESDRFRSFWF